MAPSAKQYRGNIWIWESSVAYRREVEKVLALVTSTQAGQTLVKHINAKTKYYMLIQPFKPTAKDPVNAFETPRSEGDGAPAGYVADSVPINIPMVGKIEIPTIVGTGKGTIVDIDYHPATWHEVAKRVGHIRPGDGAGEVLFHEMIHGLREMNGLMQYKDKVASEANMDSVEEFYAIMAANVYRSERGFTLLRADHWSSRRIKGALVYQSAYYEHYQPYIDKWFKEQQAFGLDMARVPAKFNPFREAAVALKLMTGPATSMRL